MKKYVGAVIIVVLAFTLFMLFQSNVDKDFSNLATSDTPSSTSLSAEVSVSTTVLPSGERVRYVVPPEDIVSGGPPKDGIPSIDNPIFVSREEAESFMRELDVVIGLYYKGVARAYPHKILVWHEIVNDIIEDTPIAVTYCPLCYTSLAFIRVINGEPVEFGTSGLLYNSNLVMYDRKTDTLWSQQLGLGILGPLAGVRLEKIQVDVMKWKLWRELYPDTEVLSTETGYSRPYGSDPYSPYLYYTSDEIWFPVKHRDDRLHPKTVIYGIIVDGKAKAYVADKLLESKVVNDSINGVKVVIFNPLEGLVRAYKQKLGNIVLDFEWHNGMFIDKQTGSEWNVYGEAVQGPLKGKKLTPIITEISFWFAWVSFYPDTEVYGL